MAASDVDLVRGATREDARTLVADPGLAADHTERTAVKPAEASEQVAAAAAAFHAGNEASPEASPGSDPAQGKGTKHRRHPGGKSIFDH